MAFTNPVVVSKSHRALHLTRVCSTRPRRLSTPAACVRSKRGAAESRALDHAVKAGVERQVAEKALGVVQRASYTASVSEFMRWEDAEKLAFSASRAIPYARIAVTGGVDEAERATLACASESAHFDEDELVQDVNQNVLRAVVLRGDLRGKVSQRDVLGTVCATVKRELVGDVALSEDGSAYVIAGLETAELLSAAITKVGGVPVDTSVELLDEVSPRELSVKEFYSVEKSTRLDAIASAGFKVSRSSMAERIRSGGVSLNQKVVKTPAKTVHTGDRISCRGLGRVELVEVDTTRKGNMRCTLRRYV